MKRICFFAAIISMACMAVTSCNDRDVIVENEVQAEPLASLNDVQRNFYDTHESFFTQFPDTMMVRWIKRIDFDDNGNLFDSKAMLLEDLITEEQFDQLLVELYATPNTSELIVYDGIRPERCKRLKNPSYSNRGSKDEITTGTLIWKRKRNGEGGRGCNFSLFSICSITDEVIVVMN